MAQVVARQRRLVERRDGRNVRAERTRDAVAEATLALIEEGDLRPTAPRIAERAGVSRRSVFQHFRDMEELHSLVGERQLRRIQSTLRPVSEHLSLDERIAAFAAERGRLCERLTPVRRAALLVEPFSREVRARLAWARQQDREDAARVFAAEIAARPVAGRHELLEALVVATSWSAWEALRAHQSLSVTQARRIMARTLTALLKETG